MAKGFEFPVAWTKISIFTESSFRFGTSGSYGDRVSSHYPIEVFALISIESSIFSGDFFIEIEY